MLLISIAASTTAGKKRKPKQCKDKKECCKDVCFDTKFEVCLSFDQEIVNGRPRPASQAPKGHCGKGVSGSLKLCFEKDLSSVHYKLCICGVRCVENLNELVTQAHLHAGRSYQNGPIIAFLFPCDPRNAIPLDCGPGIEFDGCCVEGCLTNKDIRLVESANGQEFNTIASLLDGIRRGEVYANVHGSNFENCFQDGNGMTTEEMPPQPKPSYSGGLIRGQVLAEETSG